MPPFEITSKITDLLVKIGEELARIEFFESSSSLPYLRRKNRIKTMQDLFKSFVFLPK